METTKMKPKERFKIIPAVYLFLVREGEILLLRRCNTGYEDGNWSLPAGHIDKGEGAVGSMRREIGEEIGIDVRKKDLRMIHVMHRMTGEEYNERVDFFFEAKKWKGEIENKEPYKCDTLQWTILNKLPKNTIPYIREAIKNYRRGVFFSEFGFK